MQPISKFRSSLLPPLWSLLVTGLAIGACTWFLPEVEPGGVLFQDDFSRRSSGWDRYADETYRSDYIDGEYQIEIYQPNTEAWALPGMQFEDVITNVSARKASGWDDNVFGVICRYEDPDNFIFFLISSDGYAGIGEYQLGEKRLLSSDTMLPSAAVNLGASENHLRAECIRENLRLIVNGQLVAQATTDQLSSGDVGLIAGVYDQADISIRFDNYSTIHP